MKRRICVFSLIISLVILMSGCGCSHVWMDATCTTPETCTKCGMVVDGTELEHSWADVSCKYPKHCVNCGLVEGEALEHVMREATCITPITCVNCGVKQGKALGHTWEEATCETAKTCTACGEKDGKPLGHEAESVSCTQESKCVRCDVIVEAPGHILADATCTEAATCTVCGESVGEALGHTTDNGKCDRCGQENYSTITGSGDDVSICNITEKGLYRVHFTNTGRSNFTVWVYYESGDRVLLVNEIGNYNGITYLDGYGPYTFEIQSSGSWTYTIEPIQYRNKTEFSGKGDFVTDIISIEPGAWEFTHDGKSNFAVWAYTTKGRPQLVVNEIGNYSGKRMVDSSSGGGGFFVITADGNWTARPVQ